MEDTVRSQHCVKVFKECRHLEGEVAECGVAFGQTTFMLDPYVLSVGKTLFAFDTFSGLPYDDSIITEHQCKRGEMNYGEQFFMKLNSLKKTSIKPVVGLIEDTLIKFQHEKFCFVWVDMDLYQPTSFAYKFFENRITSGGIMGFHDYKFHRCPGIEVVVDKEVDYSKYERLDCQDSCLFIRKK